MNKQEASQITIVFYNLVNLLHKSSRPHPQNPERLTTLISSIQQLQKELGNKIQMREVRKDQGAISKQETQKLLIEAHGQSYYEFVKEMWQEGIKKPQMFINLDTYFMKDTFIAALQAARTTVIAASCLAKQKPQNCFALVRPPGHHCGMKSQPHGFSFFNNIAIAANYLIQNKLAKKIVIVDWDAHHGEGTQKIFYGRKDVLYISLHRFDNGKFFPHIAQSSSKHVGEGEGAGYNINICWNLQQKPKGYVYPREQSCGDSQYYYAFSKIVLPVILQYSPDFILISCGFDSAQGDPFANLHISSLGYMWMLQKLLQINKKVLLVLEGGYNKQVLTWAGQAVIKTLTNKLTQQKKQQIQTLKMGEPNNIGKKGVDTCLEEISKYWTKI